MKKSYFLILIMILVLFITLNYQKFKCSLDKMFFKENKSTLEIDDYKDDNSKKEKIDTFDLFEFQWEIENFSFNKKYNKIENDEQLVNLAKNIWEEYLYIDELADIPYEIGIDSFEIFDIKYDNTNDVWWVYGSWKDVPISLGGIPNLLIKSDGETIAMWIDN